MPRSLPVRILCLSLAAGGLVSLAGCGKTNQYFEPPPPEVTVATPQQKDVTGYLEVTGTAQPVVSVDVRARVRGFLKERHFEEGSLVKQGQLLLVIDEEPFRLNMDQTKARYAEAQSALQKA
jgi:membrane fusion protein (multidrug efflux system)